MFGHITREAWMRDGSCNEDNAALFFPERGRSADAAKLICADCTVVQDCAAFALADHGLDGVFGGMTTGERDRQRRRTVAL